MPLQHCKDCTSEISTEALICPKCGVRLKREVGGLLGLGIFLYPYLFAWFTLRGGHSIESRVVSFAWMGFSLFTYVVLLSFIATVANN